MPANVYIQASQLRDYVDLGELAQVAAPHDVVPDDIEVDLADELDGTSTGNLEAERAMEQINAAVAAANSTVDGYLGGVFTLPLSGVPSVLTLHAARIARYELHDKHAAEEIVRRYDQAIRYLEKVANGTIRLADDSGVDDASSGGQPDYSAPSRVFDTDDISGARMGDFLGCL